MKARNEKIQAPDKRRTQEEHRHSYKFNGFNWFGFLGRSSECQPIAPDRTDWAGGNSCSDPIGAITGGIIEQLINEIEADLASTENRANQLRDKIQLLKSLGASLDK